MARKLNSGGWVGGALPPGFLDASPTITHSPPHCNLNLIARPTQVLVRQRSRRSPMAAGDALPPPPSPPKTDACTGACNSSERKQTCEFQGIPSGAYVSVVGGGSQPHTRLSRRLDGSSVTAP